MDEAGPHHRKVFVLGREATLELEAVSRQVIAESGELVLLSVGYPPSPFQSRAVGEALRLADELRLWLDTVLVTDPRQIGDEVRSDDEVTILASGRERKAIERALGPRVRLERVHAVAPPRPQHRRSRVMVGPNSAHHGPVNLEAHDHGSDARPAVSSDPVVSAEGTESIEALAGRDVISTGADTVWTKDDALRRKQAPLRVYLGAAPGVGKTYAMLGEGQRRKARGTDVVVGVVHTYERPKTIDMLRGLEVIPPRKVSYRGTTFDELDVDALIDRRPQVALIDELAHTNVPGSRRAKRWEDVMDVLTEDITVITTLNVQHLASVNDVVAQVTGVRQQETVPDWILDLADDVELVDMSPNALQRRMIHGNIYPDPRKSELALRRFFTLENLTALRDLALMRVANRVDDALLSRWSKDHAPETRERILVAVSRPDFSEDLIRRGARIAQRTRGDLLVVTVDAGDQRPDRAWIEGVEHLTRDLGGEFQVLAADDPVEGLLSFAYQQHVTQIIVGESLRSRWQELLRGSFVNRLIRKASNIDVHVIARGER